MTYKGSWQLLCSHFCSEFIEALSTDRGFSEAPLQPAQMWTISSSAKRTMHAANILWLLKRIQPHCTHVRNLFVYLYAMAMTIYNMSHSPIQIYHILLYHI